MRTNIEGTFALLEAALSHWTKLPAAEQQAFQFHHMSTDEVYCSLELGDAPNIETHAYEPNSQYSAAKPASDHSVRAWHYTKGWLPLKTPEGTMTETGIGRESADDDGLSLLSLASVMLRWRRTIIALGIIGALVGLASGLGSKRVYVSTATFIPQGSEAAASGLALAASQFGVRIPSGGGGAWSPSMYVELLRSRSLLEKIARDTVVVTEEGGRRIAVWELLGINTSPPNRRAELAVRALGRIVTASEVKTLGGVKLSVTTKWPSVSLALAERVVRGVNQFNLETRKSQAAAERQFVEIQAGDAERALRGAEDRLQFFLQRNRAISNSPELAFDRDRLQREVALRQQVYTSLLQSGEEAKIREVRDTPVITVLEVPQLPVDGEARKSAMKTVLGGVAGGMLGIVIAFLAYGMTEARRAPSEETREFVQLVKEATPRFMRRWL